MKLEDARPLALELVELLEPGATKIRVAGSIRRRRPEVGDAELLAIPRTRWVRQAQAGLFGNDVEGDPLELSELWELVSRLVADPAVPLERHPPHASGRSTPWGPRYRRLLWKGLSVDLFTATTRSWGAQALIRTGPAEFSKAWVTRIRDFGYRMTGGQVLDHAGEVVNLSGELAAFELARWTYTKPSERVAP